MIQLPKMWAACLKIGEKSVTNPAAICTTAGSMLFTGVKLV